jgi:hypothetical protein
MPRRSRRTHFLLVCGDAELREQLNVCENSDYRITRDLKTQGVAVYDGDTAMLRTEPFGGGWLVWLHRAYYRHPFGPPGDGDALPGAR